MIEFMVLIGFASVFMMISLGYEKKKDDGGYGRRFLGIFSGKGSEEEGRKVPLNNIPLNAGGLLDKVDKKTYTGPKKEVSDDTDQSKYIIKEDISGEEAKDAYASALKDYNAAQDKKEELQNEALKPENEEELLKYLREITKLNRTCDQISEYLENLFKIKQEYKISKNKKM
ncbi:MAG: hypothetical protein KAS90_00845 [Candidatus Aenigmarchaeota archaeon]|nr:hypothetical protein [Candidatus Aenigmarchaeota archaeon]